jgi:hypothetical protein
MTNNRADFDQVLAEFPVPDWSVIAAALGSCGLIDLHGAPPSAETAQETWQRVVTASG